MSEGLRKDLTGDQLLISILPKSSHQQPLYSSDETDMISHMEPMWVNLTNTKYIITFCPKLTFSFPKLKYYLL